MHHYTCAQYIKYEMKHVKHTVVTVCITKQHPYRPTINLSTNCLHERVRFFFFFFCAHLSPCLILGLTSIYCRCALNSSSAVLFIGMFPSKLRRLQATVCLCVLWAKILSPLFVSVSFLSLGIMTQEAYRVVFTYGDKSHFTTEKHLSNKDCVSDSLIIMGVSSTMRHQLQRRLEIEF